MLEFWIDPHSPYHKDFFGKNYNFIFYCASGRRSALSTLTAQEMGLKNVSMGLKKSMPLKHISISVENIYFNAIENYVNAIDNI